MAMSVVDSAHRICLFWIGLDANRYEALRSYAIRILTCFASTYLCESSFSVMNNIKSCSRASLTNAHLEECLRLALTDYTVAQKTGTFFASLTGLFVDIK